MLPASKTINFELSRTIPASPTEAFDGWLDPQCPGTPWSMGAKVVLDSKVDGLFYWLFINDAGDHKPHYGRFTIVDRPAKVQYTWMSLHTHGLESLVTVTFQQQGEDTLMTLRHENLPDDEQGRGHEKGWGHIMTQFSDQLSRRS